MHEMQQADPVRAEAHLADVLPAWCGGRIRRLRLAQRSLLATSPYVRAHCGALKPKGLEFGADKAQAAIMHQIEALAICRDRGAFFAALRDAERVRWCKMR